MRLRHAVIASQKIAGGCVTCPWHGSTFALDDQKEGMAAFTEKRKPVFRDQ